MSSCNPSWMTPQSIHQRISVDRGVIDLTSWFDTVPKEHLPLVSKALTEIQTLFLGVPLSPDVVENQLPAVLASKLETLYISM